MFSIAKIQIHNPFDLILIKVIMIMILLLVLTKTLYTVCKVFDNDISTFLKRRIPQLVTYMRLKALNIFS